MNKPIQTLLAEHNHMRKALVCFEEQLDTFERAEQPDYAVLADSLAYCRDYLDQWHHPREDAMFEILQQRNASRASSVRQLSDEHRQLAAATLRVVGVFRDVAERSALHLREDLVRSGRELSADYRDHMDWEESAFFPVVEEVFEQADWRRLKEQVGSLADCSTTNPVEQQYAALLRAISEL